MLPVFVLATFLNSPLHLYKNSIFADTAHLFGRFFYVLWSDMRILAIETSCDETAISVVEATGDFPKASYTILGDALHSQVDLHQAYGGVFPTMAKREHTKRIVPLVTQALKEAGIAEAGATTLTTETNTALADILVREPNLYEEVQKFFSAYQKPDIDLIAVTTGPGLEPALWVGINFAKALATAWQLPLAPIDHMEGHILASLYDVVEDDQLATVQFPALALLISGGHTELVLMSNWGHYEKIGQTVDDAVGEAFDKVARMLGLPYPGGPAISKLAQAARQQELPPYKNDLPRPMLKSNDLNFSFSGLKTAVLYSIGEATLSDTDKMALARDFEDAVTEVLVQKTSRAAATHNCQTVIVGGGVSANSHIKQSLQLHFLTEHPNCELYFPKPGLSTDNAIMIALAGHAHHADASNAAAARFFTADGNKSL